MKTTSKVRILLENIQREIELLNNSNLSHKEKCGALMLIDLELEEVWLLHTDEMDRKEQTHENYKNHLIIQLVKMEGLTMMCMAVLKHRTHNHLVQRHLDMLNELCRKALSEAREIIRREEDIPF